MNKNISQQAKAGKCNGNYKNIDVKAATQLSLTSFESLQKPGNI
ncbi:MAG: hypothetical protein R2784_02035 [Saprospiraceae bacterium]